MSGGYPIDSARLGPANILTVNSAADFDGDLTLIGGAGNDKLTGGSGNVL